MPAARSGLPLQRKANPQTGRRKKHLRRVLFTFCPVIRETTSSQNAADPAKKVKNKTDPRPDLDTACTGCHFCTAMKKYKIIENREDGRCLECGAVLSGRPDKKYCCSSCKNHHNNRKRDLAIKFQGKTMTLLWRNHQILEFFLRKRVTHAKMEDLEMMGFSREVVTAHRQGSNGHKEFSCFDIAYYQTPRKIFNIHRNGEPSPLVKSSSVPRDKP